MAVVETVAQVRVGSGVPVERLVCHPRLPLVAGLESERPAVRVWDWGAGDLSEVGIVGADAAAYTYAFGTRRQPTPAAAWHPDQPLLAVAREGTVVQWTAAGVSALSGLPPVAADRSLAFSPDGRTLWASPSSVDEFGGGVSSAALDLASGTVATGRLWDTGVATHPAGGLAATLCSDQGATCVVFARVDDERAPATLRMLRSALILDADGYDTPVFSADGRYFAIRGNAYENSLEVFALPSLHRVLATTLGPPNPESFPYPPEWLEQLHAWSRCNIAFGAQPAVLWIGTPAGTLIEVDVDGQHSAEYDVLAGSRVTGVAATATGELVVAGSDGELLLLSASVGSATTDAVAAEPMRSLVAAFLDSTSEVPDDGDLETHLVVTDGDRTWDQDDLAAVTSATETDPTWLRLLAGINSALDRR